MIIAKIESISPFGVVEIIFSQPLKIPKDIQAITADDLLLEISTNGEEHSDPERK